ncbi:MAG: phage/plasmid primase, P4 family [Polyangiales bacterium]
MLPDEEETAGAIGLLQEFAGAALVGMAATYAVALVLVGPGNDGKSRVLNVLRALFPVTAVCSIPPNAWGRGFLLAELAGKRLNVVSELPGADVQDGDRFKQVIAGDAMTAERKYETPFTLIPEAGHVFACNELPGTRDQSRGFWRRFAVIPCTRSFQAHEEIKDIDRQVIRAEIAGIAAWALEGAARLQREGRYSTPKASEEAKAEWQQDSDQVRQWVAARCEILPAGTSPWRENGVDKLYPDYRTWATANGHTPVASGKLASRLKALGHEHRTKIARLYRLELKVRDDG